MAAVRGIGLSGQMHGATLLDETGAVLRPCILWNDVRAAEECRHLEQRLPELGQITGNPAMPGFTAPKLMWVKKHEPEIFAKVKTALRASAARTPDSLLDATQTALDAITAAQRRPAGR